MKPSSLLVVAVALLSACNAPASALQFPTDPALGPFALSLASPVIARGAAGAPDEGGAPAPTVYVAARGRHAVYLGVDSDGGTHLLGADELDAGLWQKSSTPVGTVSGPVGRPAAAILANSLAVFYDAPTVGGPQIASTLAGGATIGGASGPCVVQVNGQVMIYAVSEADQAIHAYASPDGLAAFVDKGAVLKPSAEDGGFDAYAVSAPTVVVETGALGRTLYRLWYTGTDQPGGTVSIGLAGSFDGLAFERYTENPVRFHGDVASVYRLGDGGFEMLYSQTPFAAPTDISLATGPAPLN